MLLLVWLRYRFTGISMWFELVFETCVRLEGKSLCVDERSMFARELQPASFIVSENGIFFKHWSSNTIPFAPFVRSRHNRIVVHHFFCGCFLCRWVILQMFKRLSHLASNHEVQLLESEIRIVARKFARSIGSIMLWS